MAGGKYEPITREELKSRRMSGSRTLSTATLALVLTVPLLIGMVLGGALGYLILGGQVAAPSPPAGGNEVTFELEAHLLTGFKGIGGTIDGLNNPTLEVQKGDRVTIILVDGEVMMHNLYIEGYDIQSADVMNPGDRVTVSFTADKEGTFAYYCAIPGHRQTMEGKLIVGSGEGGAVGLPPIGPEKLPLDTNFIGREPTDVPPPVNRTYSTTVHIWLDVREVNAEIEPGTSFTYWTYNGTVPGPMFRVRVNDTVVVHFSNHGTMEHSVDFHAATGPGGGTAYSRIQPGEAVNFTFKALVPGLYVYHCGSPNVPTHVSMGMYGLILVEPEGGLPYFDARGKPIKEFYVMQGELYTKWPVHTAGNQLFDGEKLLAENPTYVVFNGRWQSLTDIHELKAAVNDTVRIYFGVGGPNLISSFHVIGEIFDRVYVYGDLLDPPLQGIQTVPVVPGGSVVVEFAVQVPGRYVLVDHSLTRALDKGALGFLNVTGPSDPTIFAPLP